MWMTDKIRSLFVGTSECSVKRGVVGGGGGLSE